jgi:hypothetical protein
MSNNPIGPLQLAFYKGAGGKWGALQLSPQRPHWYVKDDKKLKNFDGKYIPKDWLTKRPELTKDDLTSREGCIFLDITSAKGKNEYDWEDKITMALSVHDLGKILLFLAGQKPDLDIFHDPGAKTAAAGKVKKTLRFSSPGAKGLLEGAIVTVTETSADGTQKKHTVPLSADEVLLLRSAVHGFIPTALGWA